MGSGRSPFFVCFLFFCFSSLMIAPTVHAQVERPLSPKEEVKEIDLEIRRLEEDQTKQKLLKARWEDLGQRWQFQNNMTQEAKRAFQKADDAQRQMDLNEQHLNALKARRAKIIEEHPGAAPPSDNPS